MICGLHEAITSRLLMGVARPGRYLGNHGNFPRKTVGRLKFLLCFPDLYEIGMSNLGIRILYHVIDRHEDSVADLAFAPWGDMEAVMRTRNIPLYGLGTGLGAKEFDVVGFSLQHELQYTNVLNMLDLAGIPVLARDRRGEDPVILAGGPCAFNPGPMSAFIDAFVVGDGETVVVEVADRVLSARSEGRVRSAIVHGLGQIDGVYVPGAACAADGSRTVRRVEPELRDDDFPLPPIVPIIPITHDRLTVEVMRGCTRGCRFCSAGMLARPVRQRSVESVLRLAQEGIDSSGWDEVSLVSLSTSDYYDLGTLVGRLAGMLGERKVSISLPSMRPDAFSDDVARLIARAKTTGLTFAPEAGSERLRKCLNKDIDDGVLYQTVERAFRNGWDSVKLYFMVGLPGEDESDIEALVRMTRSVASICRGFGRRRKATVSLSPFVPRPHTPFQWEAQAGPEAILSRVNAIRRGLGTDRIKLKWRDPYMSLVEGLLARGDERFGEVILAAWKAGARFDGWTDRFDFGLWMRCAGERGISVAGEIGRRDPDAPLAWHRIDGGVSLSFLKAEASKAKDGRTTPDCRYGACSKCGACPGEVPARANAVAGEAVAVQAHRAKPKAEAQTRWRVRYEKAEEMRFYSHLDLARCLARGMRRAGLPVCYSEGYSPHPRVSFGPPLPLGVTGQAEYFDVSFSGRLPEGWIGKLNECLPPGLKAFEARLIPGQGLSIVGFVNAASYRVVLHGAQGSNVAALGDALRQALGEDGRVIDLKTSAENGRSQVEIVVRLKRDSSGPEKVIERVLEGAWPDFDITRTGLYSEREGVLYPPIASGTAGGR